MELPHVVVKKREVTPQKTKPLVFRKVQPFLELWVLARRILYEGRGGGGGNLLGMVVAKKGEEGEFRFLLLDHDGRKEGRKGPPLPLLLWH